MYGNLWWFFQKDAAKDQVQCSRGERKEHPNIPERRLWMKILLSRMYQPRSSRDQVLRSWGVFRCSSVAGILTVEDYRLWTRWKIDDTCAVLHSTKDGWLLLSAQVAILAIHDSRTNHVFGCSSRYLLRLFGKCKVKDISSLTRFTMRLAVTPQGRSSFSFSAISQM